MSRVSGRKDTKSHHYNDEPYEIRVVGEVLEVTPKAIKMNLRRIGVEWVPKSQLISPFHKLKEGQEVESVKIRPWLVEKNGWM